MDGPRTTEAFVEAFGMAMAAQGMPRNAGRVLGALLVADPPERTAEALAEGLAASRGSVSTMTRLLEGVGLVERVAKPGDRRHYYRIRRGGIAAATAQRVQGMKRMAELAGHGLRLLDDAPDEVRSGLLELKDFYEYWADETEQLAAAYLDRVRSGAVPGGPAGRASGPSAGPPAGEASVRQDDAERERTS